MSSALRGAAWGVLLALGLAACGVRSVQSPQWVMGDSERYPAQRYLLGVGTAPTQGGLSQAFRAASAAARSELAQVLEVRVEHVQRLDSQWHRTGRRATDGSARLAVEAERSSLRSFTQTTTRQIVQGIEIKEKYHDTRHGVLYVLAVLDKQQAAERLEGQIEDLQRRVAQLLQAAGERRARGDLLAAVREHRGALQLALRADVLLEQLRVIDPLRARSVQLDPSGPQVAAAMSDLFAQYGFAVSVEGYPLLEETIRETLVAAGLAVCEAGEAGRAGLTLWGRVDRKQGTYPSLSPEDDRPLHVCRMYLGLKLVDDASGRIVGQVNLVDNSNAEDPELAAERALTLLRQRIRRELPAALYQALSMEPD